MYNISLKNMQSFLFIVINTVRFIIHPPPQMHFNIAEDETSKKMSHRRGKDLVYSAHTREGALISA